MSTTFARPRTLRLAAFAAGAIAVAGSAVAVTASAAGFSFNLGGSPSGSATPAGLASAPDDSAATSAACSDFMNHFTADLGSSQSKVNAAFQQAIAETLADQVKAGKLTQAQADAIKKRLAGKNPCSIGPALTPNNAKGPAAAYAQELIAAAASALGIDAAHLKTDLGNGMSLSQIAAAHNPPITEDQFRAKLIAALKPLLDQAAANHRLTSQQEQKILARLQTGPIPFWDKAPKKPAAGSPPTTTTTSTS